MSFSLPVRLAFFCDSLEPSGVGRVMELLARELPDTYELYAILADAPGADGVAARLRPYVRDLRRLTVRDYADVNARHELVSQLRAWNIDIFHNHVGVAWEGCVGTRTARQAGVPIVVATEHLPCLMRWDHELREKREENARLDCLFTVSESARQSILASQLMPPERLVTIANGADEPSFASGHAVAHHEVCDELGLPHDVKFALFAGRLMPQKDPWTLLYTLKTAAETEPNLHLLLAGDGPLREELQNLAREWNIEERAHFLGHRADLPRLLAACELLLLPSQFEGLPLVALEAMAMSKPVVGCDVPGLRDCVRHNETGWLAHACDFARLSHGVLLALGETGNVWGAAGRARFCREFSAKAMAARQDAAYRDLLAPTRTASVLQSQTEQIQQLPQQQFPQQRPQRVLWVFAWLVVGGEETEVRLLSQSLDASRFQIDVVACFRQDNMPTQTHAQLEALGVCVDRTPYALDFNATVAYLAHKMRDYDLVVASQAVPDVYAAYEYARWRGYEMPPLIEHGGLVSEATALPKTHTTRYVGVCDSIREAAANAMPERAHHALRIPSVVDLREFSPDYRELARHELGVAGDAPLVGWCGRLDRKKRVDDFVRACALVRESHPHARFVVIGGPDAFMPEYADELRALSSELGLDSSLQFLGDRADVPRLLSALDVLCWLSRGEGMPHIISEAGAARVPVVATRDNGSEEQITHGETGLFVSHESPHEVGHAVRVLLDDAGLRRELGDNLRLKVEREYEAGVVARQWEALFDEVLTARLADGAR